MAKTEGYIVTVEVFVSKMIAETEQCLTEDRISKKEGAIRAVEGILGDEVDNSEIKNVRKI